MATAVKAAFALLDQQIDVMRHVKSSLDSEREALLARDPDALEQALVAKNRWLTRAAELEQARQSAPTIESPRLDSSGRWNELMELIRQCQDANVHNGALIRGQRRLVQNTLMWLRGDDDRAGTYGPDGAEPGRVKTRASLAAV